MFGNLPTQYLNNGPSIADNTRCSHPHSKLHPPTPYEAPSAPRRAKRRHTKLHPPLASRTALTLPPAVFRSTKTRSTSISNPVQCLTLLGDQKHSTHIAFVEFVLCKVVLDFAQLYNILMNNARKC